MDGEENASSFVDHRAIVAAFPDFEAFKSGKNSVVNQIDAMLSHPATPSVPARVTAAT
jgi:hypothetical protein